MKTLIQAAEVWVPDHDGYLLEFGGGLYDNAVEFGAASRGMCFGRGEGLPGRVWDEGHPILLTDLQSGHFRRAAAARRAGLSCAVALPCYAASVLQAVVVFYCGGGESNSGAVELWRSQADEDLALFDGHYGSTHKAFVTASRHMRLPRGTGLPGRAWQRGSSVFVDGLPETPKFLRADVAGAAGLERGLALPCPVPGGDSYVLTMLGSAAQPIARRLESWVPAASGQGLQRAYGHCASSGALAVGEAVAGTGGGEDSLAGAYASAAPRLQASAGLIALPVVKDGAVVEVVALYL